VGAVPGPRSATGYAAMHFGVPGIIAEVGGLGFGDALERGWREQNIDGVLGVMGHLEMLDRPIDASARPEPEFVVFTKDWIVRPRTSGLLIPSLGPERLGTKVASGEQLARIVSATTFEELDVLRAPRAGLLFCIARSYPVQPHNYAFGAVDLEALAAV